MSPADRLGIIRRLAPFALAAAVALAWVAMTGRWEGSAWRSPGGSVSGDILEVAARVQVAAEQFPALRDTYGRIDRLGAPVGADWSAYPVPDRLVYGIAGMISRSTGVFAAINLLIALGFVLNALSFHLAARALGARVEWAMSGGFLFAFAIFHQQWAGTLSLGWTLALPPLAFLLHVVAGRGTATLPAALWRRRLLLAAGTGVWLGTGNPYFVFGAAPLIVGALALQAGRGRLRPRLQVGLILLAGILVGGLVSHRSWILANGGSDTSPLGRNYSGTELYGLRPIELLLPPASHRADFAAELGRDYAARTLFRSSEPISGYLGLAGLAGLVALVALGRRRTRPAARSPEGAWAVGALLLLGCVGGINSLLAFAGIDQFRAGNRLAVVIVAWCLLAFVAWLNRRLRLRPAWSWGLAATVAILGWLDQTPTPRSARYEGGLAILAADADSARRLADAAGRFAPVFQLPAMPFPEAPAQRDLADYEHFRLFLAAPELRFAYGGLRGSTAQRWYEWAARQPAADLPGILEAHGFGAIVVDARGYAPDEFAALIDGLRRAGARPLPLPESRHLTAFTLSPRQPAAAVDPSDPRFDPPWRTGSGANSTELTVLAATGWYAAETEGRAAWRWARGAASATLWTGRAEPVEVQVAGEASAASPGHLDIVRDGQSVWSGLVRPGEYAPILFRLTAAPGATRLEFRFDGELVRPPGETRELGLVVRNLHAERAP